MPNLARADGLELLPDASEAVWAIASTLLLVGLVALVGWLVLRARAAATHRRELERRVERLEDETVRSRPA